MLPQLPQFYELDPKKQESLEWANSVIGRMRMDWRPVIETGFYAEMKALLLSCQSVDYLKEYFEDEAFIRNNKFNPLPFFEKARNIITNEVKTSGIKPYISAVDPSAKKDKDDDRNMLQTRKIIEAKLNDISQRTGLPPTKIKGDDFNGNIDDFDEMGLDDSDQSDVEFFFKTHFKLDYEAVAQTMVNAILKLNSVENEIPRYVNDIMSVKAVCQQNFISPLTGEIKTLYLQPNQTFCIFGNKRNGTDAPVKGWEKQITIKQLLTHLGASFDFERDWKELVSSINYGNNTNFDGFLRGTQQYCLDLNFRDVDKAPASNSEKTLNLLNWDDAITSQNYKIYFGYIEFEQPYVHTERKNAKTGQMFSAGFEYEQSKRSLYERQDWGAFIMKCSYYLATGVSSQRLYGYGNLYGQLFEGQYDEYCSGSISIIREEGLSAVQVARTYIDLGNYAYYKMFWAIHRSKPDVWSWSYESILEVAMKMKSTNAQTNSPQDSGFNSALNDLVDLFEKKLIMLHTYPQIDGKPTGGGGMPHQKIQGSLDALALQLREFILEWAENQILDKLGISGLRNAEQPNPKDSPTIAQLGLKQSAAATGYIPDMVQQTLEHTAKISLNYALDIIKHKMSKPFKWLKTMLGNEAIVSLEKLDNICAHRYGVFVSSFNVAREKEEINQAAGIALANQIINFSEWLLIKNIEDPRMAAVKMAYLQEKGIKRKQQEAMQIQQAQQRAIQMNHQADMELADLKGKYGVQEKQLEVQSYVAAAQIAAENKINVKELQVASEAPKQEARTQGDIELMNEEKRIKEQAPLNTV